MNSLKQTLKKIDFIKVAEVILAISLTFAPLLVANAQLNKNLTCDSTTGLNCNAGTTVNGLIKTVISWLLGIAFAVAVLFLIVGGFLYITAGGNEEQVEKGKSTVINAIIGIVIIVLSYVIISVISQFVANPNGTASAG